MFQPNYLDNPLYSPQTTQTEPSIIPASAFHKSNGRVDVLSEPIDAKIKMFERTQSKNKTQNYSDALIGNLEESVLSRVFFSAENVQILQNGLRAGVYAKSKNQYILPPQNMDALHIIMRSTFLQHAALYDAVKPIPKQVEELNKIVLDYVIPELYSSAVSYMKYLQDQNTLAVPLARPQNHDRDFKELEMRVGL